MIRCLLENITESTATEPFYPNRCKDEQGVIQIAIVGSSGGTKVEVQGRVGSFAPWVNIAEYTASGAMVIPILPQMRLNATVGSGDSVSAWIAE